MPGTLFMAQERERVTLDLLRRHGAFPLADKRILDVGCGAGKPLLRFLQYGARPENLFGVDLLEDEINVARELAPHLHFEVADARQLPFEDGTMDLVLAIHPLQRDSEPIDSRRRGSERCSECSAGPVQCLCTTSGRPVESTRTIGRYDARRWSASFQAATFRRAG